MPAQTYPNSPGNVEKTVLSYPIMVTERRDCMDLLQEMNQVIAYIEENLTGMSLSEHIRRRRLSQAVFDLQNSNEKIVDIALKYGYESPATFTRAFRELHGVTPSSVRKTSVPLKTYPPITFLLTVKGVTGMEFRIEKKECFQIMGLSGYDTAECGPGLRPRSTGLPPPSRPPRRSLPARSAWSAPHGSLPMPL